MATIGLSRNTMGTWNNAKDDEFFQDEKTGKMNRAFVQVLKTDDVFQWLDTEYKRRYTSQKSNNDYLLIAEFDEVREYNGINENYRGMKFARWINDNVKSIEYLLVDLDDLQEQDTSFTFDVVEERFKETGLKFRLWSSFSHNEKANKLKYRALVQLENPIHQDGKTDVTASKKQAIKQLEELLSINVTDETNKTWRQPQGAPLQNRAYAGGGKTKLKNELIEQKPKKSNIISMNKINKTSATQTINHYIKRDSDNLKDEMNCFSALMVLATSVQNGEIEEEQARQYAKRLADVAPDETTKREWAQRNIERLEKELEKIPHLEVRYSFDEKFKKTVELKSTDEQNMEIVEELLENVRFLRVETSKNDRTQLSFYDDESGLYETNEERLEDLIWSFAYGGNERQIKDIIFKLRKKATIKKLTKAPHLIAVNNGIYNTHTSELEPFTSDYVFQTKITTNYVEKPPKPSNFDIDEFLSDLACGDDEIVKLLWEVINEAVNGNATRGKFFIIVGDGGNGKSTFQELIQNLVGIDNTSHLRIEDFNDRFKPYQLKNAIVNLGDDIQDRYLEDTANLNSTTTGQPILVERKGEQAVPITSYATSIFSANSVPMFRNRSNGTYRRMVIIPFENDFTRNGLDTTISEKIKDPKILEYVLYRALNVDFAQDELSNDVFTIPERSKELANQHMLDGDSVLAFFTEQFLDIDGTFYDTQEAHTSTVYKEFEYWCAQNNEAILKHRNFMNRFVKHAKKHGFEKKPVRIGGKLAQGIVKE